MNTLEVKYKYKLGQQVWLIFADEIRDDTIVGFDVKVRYEKYFGQKLNISKLIVVYYLKYGGSKAFQEHKLFSTKDELLDSLR